MPQRSTLHASTHVPRIHLSESAHSASLRQPTSSCRIGWQRPWLSVIVSGGHLHIIVRIGDVSNTVQVCCKSQISDRLHGFSQRRFTHVNCGAQFESLVQSGRTSLFRPHSTYGLPNAPGWQSQTAWWIRPSQRACGAHESNSHTGRHTRFKRSHASWSWQSSLYWQWPRTHEINGFPCVPAGQMQLARWFCAKHSASRPHCVDPCVHGLKQFSL